MPPLQDLKKRALQLLASEHSLQEQCLALTGERNALQQECENFRVERDNLSTQNQELRSAREALQAERDSLATQLQELAAQRDLLQQERDSLRVEHDNLSIQHQELCSASELLQAERDSLATQANEIKNNLQEKIELLSAANSLLTQESDETKRNLWRIVVNQEVERASNKSADSAFPTRNNPDSVSDLLVSHLARTTNASDKWESYFFHYARNLSLFRNRDKGTNLLEIGVQNGGSLEAWKDFLGPESIVSGTDINNICSLIESPDPIRCFTGDATDATWAAQLCAAKGPFDIVIDDGSHINSDIEKTFALFFPSVAPGGVYACEDLHTAYWPQFGGSSPSRKENVIEMFKEIADLVNLEHWQNNTNTGLSEQIPRLWRLKESHPSLTIEVLMTIESIEFCNSMVFIRKKSVGKCSLGQRVVSKGRTTVCAEVLDANGQRPQSMGYS